MLIYGVGIYSSSISYTLCLFFFASQNHEDLREHISDEYFPFYLLQMCRFIITVEHPTLRKLDSIKTKLHARQKHENYD
jgi:hypothetical protein